MCPAAENKLSINIVIFIKAVLLPRRHCFVCGDDPGKCKSRLASLLIKEYKIFSTSSFTYDESETYDTHWRMEPGLEWWVKLKDRSEFLLLLVILHPSFVRDTII